MASPELQFPEFENTTETVVHQDQPDGVLVYTPRGPGFSECSVVISPLPVSDEQMQSLIDVPLPVHETHVHRNNLEHENNTEQVVVEVRVEDIIKSLVSAGRDGAAYRWHEYLSVVRKANKAYSSELGVARVLGPTLDMYIELGDVVEDITDKAVEAYWGSADPEAHYQEY